MHFCVFSDTLNVLFKETVERTEKNIEEIGYFFCFNVIRLNIIDHLWYQMNVSENVVLLFLVTSLEHLFCTPFISTGKIFIKINVAYLEEIQ